MKVHLRQATFDEVERVAVEHAGLTASLFRYSTGVEAVRLSNGRGHLVVLPLLGQMIWQAAFDGVDMTRKSSVRGPGRAPGPSSHRTGRRGCQRTRPLTTVSSHSGQSLAAFPLALPSIQLVESISAMTTGASPSLKARTVRSSRLRWHHWAAV